MMAVARTMMDRLLAAYQRGSRLALFFDFDGTLVPIVDHPRLAELSPHLRWVLAHLGRQPRLSVGILSGRPLDELKGKVGLPGLYYCGTSGLELDLCGARLVPSHAEHGRKVIEKVRPVLEGLAAEFPGAWVERKPMGLTLHYRAVHRFRQQKLLSCADEQLRSHAKWLRIVDGPKAIEVTADVGWTKGFAIRTFVRDIGPGTMPFYAGDAANDSDAIEATQELGGVTVRIGPQPIAAQYQLPDPAALGAWLAELLDALKRTRLAR